MVTGRVQSLLVGALLWLLALTLCTWVYWPGLAGPPLLDDAANLRPLELLVDQPDLITDVVAGNLSGPLGRPLTMLSFSLEQVYLGGDLRAKKQLNLWLHLFIASLLLVFCRDLFRCLGQPHALALSLGVASLWLFAPLLLSTVLYSVQRMAQLATLFTLLALWAYLRCRLTTGWSQPAWGLLSVVALLAAPLSKENGLLALPLLMLLEWTVLRFSRFGALARRRWIRVHVVLVAGAVVLLVMVILLRPEFFHAGYGGRDFDLVQRVLTQTRILWTYVAQLLWADSGGLGLYRGQQELSHGLLQPVSTLLAVLGWCCVALAALWLAWRRATAGCAFGLGFFMVAHAMESTIFPLEMYFEHRNYLPAVGLFIALLSATSWLVSRLSWCVNWLLLVWLGLLGHALLVTAAEAQLWSNNQVFHINAVNRFPDSARANMELARVLAEGGDLERALHYMAIGERLENNAGLRQQLRRVALHCLAGPAIAPQVVADLSATAEDFRDAKVSEMIYVVVKNIADGYCAETDMAALADRLKELTQVTDLHYVSPKIYVSLAILENHIERYEQALEYIDALLTRSPGSVRGLMMKLYFTSVLQLDAEHRSAIQKLQQLEAQGLLNRQQQYNLGLFTPADSASPE